MTRARNVARVLALLMTIAMLFAIFATANLPLMIAPLGTALANAVPLGLSMTLAVFLAARVCCWDTLFMASIARAGPVLVNDVLDDGQFMTKEQRRLWARKFPTGFRQRRLIAKHGLFETTSMPQSCTTMPPCMKVEGDPLAEKVLRAGITDHRSVHSLHRKAQCNLFAFNANDECTLVHAAAA